MGFFKSNDNFEDLFVCFGDEFLGYDLALFDAVCLSDCEVLQVKKADFEGLFSNNEFLKMYLKSSFELNKALFFAINFNFNFDVSSKILYLLKEDVDFFNTSKRVEVAKVLNMKPETLSRALKSLQREGLIFMDDGYILLT